MAGHVAALGPAQGRQDLLERMPVAFAGHHGLLGSRQETLGVTGQLGQKLVKTLTRDG